MSGDERIVISKDRGYHGFVMKSRESMALSSELFPLWFYLALGDGLESFY